MLTFAARGIFWVTLPLAMGLLLFAGVVLSAFGDRFVSGQTALRILCLGVLIGAFAGSVSYLLVMTGHHREAARVTGGIALLNAILNALMIPRFGIAGAAYATAVSTAVWKVCLLVLVKRRLSFDPSVLGLTQKSG